MRNFKDLKVWSIAHKCALETYRITKGFPKEEMYGLTSQLRRAASSIPTNIAEGSGRRTEKDFARFLTIATGSASEVEYLLILSKDLNYINSETANSLSTKIIETRKMLSGFINKLKA